ncbi:MAG: single-stranded-DNA-specific exonuclease RecJ [Chitinophagaceae bacterium]|nr:single-stranded-DNA-specific exonuclease RecJ [Chitinophagaceae bacterium]MBK8929002.1 single-stranded-DNA-specific exonuclease RecJ [Chitinophagaceae bacterium]
MEKRWTIQPVDENKVALLKEQLHINTSLCRLLIERDIETFSAARNFFRPSLEHLHSPWLMKDMDKAVARIEKAFLQKEKILVFGDYDVDGTTAVACMYDFLCSVYETQLLDFYIPHRYREGYGVSKAGIDFAEKNGFSLIICLDCGIKSTELITYASTLGIDFIVCDHHLPDKILPKALAILNAKQPHCFYPYKELCGCGVGFKLITALAEKLFIPQDKIFTYLDLVATAIAADIVPITGENRVMAFYGLDVINKNPRPGIKALIELGGVNKKLSINTVVFVIAPRVNAAGRMDDARKAVQLFIEKDKHKAFEYAEALHTDNANRKETDSSITLQALEILRKIETAEIKKTTVVYNEGWHKGVVGIVASRLIERYHRPTIVLTKSGDTATGSARSIPGFNLYDAIYECRGYLTAYGGHFAAAGLSLLPENVGAFSQKFEEVVAATIDEHLLIPEINIDATISFADITEKFYDIICQMEPFGPGNMRPHFLVKNICDTGYSKIVKDNHIKFSMRQQSKIFEGIGFNLAHKFSYLHGNQPVDLVFTIDENEWNGNKSLQLKVIDLRPGQYMAL